MNIQLLRTLYTMSHDERIEAYIQMNQFVWPPILVDFEPPYWDTLDDSEKYHLLFTKNLWKEINLTLSFWERTEAWWRIVLHKSSDEHMQYWLNIQERIAENDIVLLP